MACGGSGTQSGLAADEVADDSTDMVEDTLVLLEEAPEPVAADMLFDDFFYAFTTDMRYQLQRVRFPLKGKEGDEELSVSADEWRETNLYASQEFFSMIYERDDDIEMQRDTALSEVSVEWFYLAGHYVERYNFHRIGGKWMLTDFEKEQTAHTPHASFMEFYAQFVSDTVFQKESVEFPLALAGEDEEGDEEAQTEISEDEWADFRNEMPLPQGVMTNIDYGQAVLSQNRKILLVQGLSSGLQVRYKFDRTHGRWRLYEVEF